MKNLKEYICESLLDDEEDLVDNDDAIIRNFLEKNYAIRGTYTIKDGIVDVDGSIHNESLDMKSITNGLFKFGYVDGNFIIRLCPSLKSLEGAPEKVGMDFRCYGCKSLKSLEGAPKEVGGDFDCYNCLSLKTLEGSPKKVGENFDCHKCLALISLKGAPKKIGGNFYCHKCISLTSLEGAPKAKKIISDL